MKNPYTMTKQQSELFKRVKQQATALKKSLREVDREYRRVLRIKTGGMTDRQLDQREALLARLDNLSLTRGNLIDC